MGGCMVSELYEMFLTLFLVCKGACLGRVEAEGKAEESRRRSWSSRIRSSGGLVDYVVENKSFLYMDGLQPSGPARKS